MKVSEKMKKTFLCIMCGIVALTLVTGCRNEKGESLSNENKNSEKEVKNEDKIYSCESTTSGITNIREINIKDNKLVIVTNTETWNYDSNHEGTCENRKYNSGRLNKLDGVSSTIDCDEYKGNIKTIFDIDKTKDISESDLVEQRYISSDNTFDVNKWKKFYEGMNYTCSER